MSNAVPLIVTTAIARDRLDDDRQNRNKAKEDGTEERDAVHDMAEEFLRALAGTDAGNESPAPLEILRHLFRIKRDRRVEIREEENEHEVEYAVIQLISHECRREVRSP